MKRATSVVLQIFAVGLFSCCKFMLWCDEQSKKSDWSFLILFVSYRDQVEVNRVNAEKENKKEAKRQREQEKKDQMERQKKENELRKNFHVRKQQLLLKNTPLLKEECFLGVRPEIKYLNSAWILKLKNKNIT